jgi:hypothetical protein
MLYVSYQEHSRRNMLGLRLSQSGQKRSRPPKNRCDNQPGGRSYFDLGVLGNLYDHNGSPAVIIEHLDRDEAFASWVVKNDNAHADLRTRSRLNSGCVRMEVVED